MARFLTAQEAGRLIKDRDTILVSGFGWAGLCEEVFVTLERRFLETGNPRDLTAICPAAQSDGMGAGFQHLGHEGMVRRVILGHWGLVPKLQKLAMESKIEAYCFPQGVLSIMCRDVAAKRPTITTVGLDTYVDPRQSGGRMNDCSPEDLVSLIHVDGQEMLHYKPFKPSIGFVRGTTADRSGNISMEREALTLEMLAVAMAVRNSGGTVIAQVERISDEPLHSRSVTVPGLLVDAVVLTTDPKKYHWQTWGCPYDAAFSGEERVATRVPDTIPLNERKVIGRRALMEIKPGSVVNVGVGTSEAVFSVAIEECVMDLLTPTVEAGHVGGLPCIGKDFGISVNSDAILDQPAMFDFYDGGGMDIAFLGMAQVDVEGNVNVSRFGGRIIGPGGFINISQNCKKLVLCGSFTAKGLRTRIADGRLEIESEGQVRKFVKSVEHITFSGRRARKLGQSVLYVTERAVFELTPEGLELIEIAPGIDLERDVLGQMGFRPRMSHEPRLMDARYFKDEPVGYAAELKGSAGAMNAQEIEAVGGGAQ